MFVFSFSCLLVCLFACDHWFSQCHTTACFSDKMSYTRESQPSTLWHNVCMFVSLFVCLLCICQGFCLFVCLLVKVITDPLQFHDLFLLLHCCSLIPDHRVRLDLLRMRRYTRCIFQIKSGMMTMLKCLTSHATTPKPENKKWSQPLCLKAMIHYSFNWKTT